MAKKNQNHGQINHRITKLKSNLFVLSQQVDSLQIHDLPSFVEYAVNIRSRMLKALIKHWNEYKELGVL